MTYSQGVNDKIVTKFDIRAQFFYLSFSLRERER